MRIIAIVNLEDPYNRRILPGAAEFARLKKWELAIHSLRHPADIPLCLMMRMACCWESTASNTEPC